MANSFSPPVPRAAMAQTERSTRSNLGALGLYVFLISVSGAYYLLNARVLLGHYDLGWHLAAGDLIRAQAKIPLYDPWSFTAGSTPWRNLSWGWDVIASAVFQRAHFSGLVVLTLACGAAIVGTLARICRRVGAPILAVCISVMAASLLYPAFAAFPNVYLAASPNMATMLFAVIFYGECLQRSRRIFLLPAIMLFWANLHGGFVLGIFLVGIFCGTALLRRDWAGLKNYTIVTGACLLAACINPLGWHIYQAATTTVGNYVQAYITEWWPYYRNITMPGSLPGILYILLFVAFELRGKESCPLEARLLSWLFLGLGFYQFRYLAFFFLFSTVPVALHLSRVFDNRRDGEKFLWGAGIAASCALLLIFTQMEPGFGLPPMVSEQDVQYLESHYPHARLLNHWNYGGLLVFYMRGAIPIFVDGRAATAYPQSLLSDYFPLAEQSVNQAAWDHVLAKYNINAVLWMKTHRELRAFLVGKKGWRQVYSGEYAALYVKP